MPSIGCVNLPYGTQTSVSETHGESTDCKPFVDSNDSQSDPELDIDVDNAEPELINKIVSQVEYYFSDENLIKDEFISKHIRRNKDGFISLKLLSSFRKVKVITKSCKLVAHCVKMGSTKLELNDADTKIRRKSPLPTLDGDKHSRTVIAVGNFGTDSIDSIGKEFSQFGDIALIRLLKTGSTTTSSSIIPTNQLNIIKNKYDLNRTTVATIEFINKSSAEEALKLMHQKSDNNWRNGIEVMAMKNSPIHMKNENQLENRENISLFKSYKSNDAMNYYNNYYNNKSNKRPVFQRQKSKSYSSGDEKKVFETVFRKQLNKSIDSNTTQATNGIKLPPNVVRLPRGPDGTTGFNTNRNHRSHSQP